MSTYKIQIKETLIKIVEIEAESVKEAAEKVKEKYDNNIINLDHCYNLSRVDFDSLITIDMDKIKESLPVVINRDDKKLNQYDIWSVIADTEKHHNHNIIIKDGKYYWEETIEERDDLNKKWAEWTKLGLTKNSEEVRDYYRSIGYSLYGYWEIFYWEANNPDANIYNPNKKGK